MKKEERMEMYLNIFIKSYKDKLVWTGGKLNHKWYFNGKRDDYSWKSIFNNMANVLFNKYYDKYPETAKKILKDLYSHECREKIIARSKKYLAGDKP
jgi:hypothetical protein